ncbi:hypothetical protein OF820_05285 [Oceanotoga sp. DSM 15011]|jgi:hypothetical protein|nr:MULTISPECIES: hypothetical protein [Oceanotoga]MDN5343191.1 hypothetical protein [Oceanotoga sp.]MDO7976261.1 hypothetical protein [Oceanotoga teriensis]UYP01097.1 hypothetical protein OF820_05285 [Oceanotoga sp. DSM 15011]
MKKYIVFLMMIVLSISIFAYNNFKMGFTVLTDDNPFRLALKTGYESEYFNFSFDFNPNFGENFYLITITDLSLKILDINENSQVRGGLLWLNDRPNSEFQDKNRNILYGYMGIGYSIENLYAGLALGYPISNEFKPTTNISDYLIFNIEYTIPKPAEFVDDLKISFRFANYRKDFSLFISYPIF